MRNYVADTNSIVFYFEHIFEVKSKISDNGLDIIRQAISGSFYSDVRLIIPSIVLIEIYDKFCLNEENKKKVYFEVVVQIIDSPNIFLQPLEKELLIHSLSIGAILENHDLHDKLVVASAIMFECPIITSDDKVQRYVSTSNKIPACIC